VKLKKAKLLYDTSGFCHTQKLLLAISRFVAYCFQEKRFQSTALQKSKLQPYI